VADGFELWSQQFDREMKDVFAIQEEVARAVADQLSVELVGEDLRPILGRKTSNLEAYELFLKGISFANENTPDGLAKAIDVLQQAGRLDPDYAEPHAVMAACYANQASAGWVLPRDVMPDAKREALKALELNDRSAQAHVALAAVKWLEWDWSGAGAEFRQAIEISPAFRQAHASYAQYLSFVGRSDEAIAAARKALELDPLSVGSQLALAFTLTFAGRFEEALAESQKTLEMNARFFPAYWYLAIAHLNLGNRQEAIRAAEQGRSLSGDPLTQAILGLAYATGGRRADALRILEELKRKRSQGYLPSFAIALVYEGLGDFDGAFEWLEKAYEERDATLPSLNARPKSDPLRSDPRAQDLLERMGLGD
jgi:tetratricopeptide (TPR) repeat protein